MCSDLVLGIRVVYRLVALARLHVSSSSLTSFLLRKKAANLVDYPSISARNVINYTAKMLIVFSVIKERG